MNIAHWIDTHAAFRPGKVALSFENRDISYACLAERINRAVSNLVQKHGVVAGDRIAWLGLNHPDQLVLLFACARIGAMLCPLNWRLTVAEHAYQLRDSGAKLLFTDGAFAAHIHSLCKVVEDFSVLSRVDAEAGGECSPYYDVVDSRTPVLLVYSSGTTGYPKGVVLSQEALLINALMSLHMHDMTSQDVVLTSLPMFHVGGLNIQTLPAV